MKYKKLNIIKKERIRVYVRMLKKIHNRCFLALFNGKSTIVIGSRDKDDDMKIDLNVREINSYKKEILEYEASFTSKKLNELLDEGNRIKSILIQIPTQEKSVWYENIFIKKEELEKFLIEALNNEIVRKIIKEI